MSGIPTEMEFEKGMENEIAMPKKKRVYKIVSVIQPPFMQWNENEGKLAQVQNAIPRVIIFDQYKFIYCFPSLCIFGRYLKLLRIIH